MLDNIKNKNVVAFSAAAIMANGHYHPKEKEMVSSIAESLDINAKELLDAIDKEIAKQEPMSAEEEYAYLQDLSKDLSPEDTIDIYQICIVLTTADDKLCKMEAMRLHLLAEILQVHAVYSSMLIAYAVKKNPDLVVEFSL